MKVEAGVLLVASAKLHESAFMRTVIYLLEHNQDGTLGFIINRPLDIPLRELWDECPAALNHAKIAAEGGPVDRHKGLLLHGCLDLPGAQLMGRGLAIGGEIEELARRYAAGIDATGPRLFLGHSGWAPGQLLGEIDDGAWIVRPGDTSMVLNHRPADNLWQHLLEGMGGLPKPSLN